jgi:RecA-family ATPase
MCLARWKRCSAGRGPKSRAKCRQQAAFYIYCDARGRNYLGVKRTTSKQFPQYHWDGTQWRKGLPKGFLKIPYRLPELLDAPADAWVVIAAGEKDAETTVRLGLVGTTNSGGEGKGQWTPELNRWFTGKQRVAIMEDNDAAGYAHAIEVANALRGIVPDIRIVGFRELKKGGDLTDWIEVDPTRGYAELLARIEAAPATDGYDAPKPAPIRHWAGKPVPEQEYTVPDRYPAEQFGLFSGEGAEGKSTIIQHLCAAHSLGRAWLGCVPRQGPAIYLECEDAESVLWRRLAAIATHYSVPIETFADAGLQLFSLIDHDTILAATNKRGIVEPTRSYQWLYELAGDLKPVQIGIASVANVFAGNEISRTEVQQFAKLMNRITKVTKGSIVLATHPSLTGISATSLSHEGLSGTTQWHNAVRARAVIKGVKPKDNEGNGVIDTGLRSITFHKNQYGPPVASCFVRWQNGLYLPVEGTTQDAAKRAAKAEDLTIILLQRFTAQNRNVSINRNPNNYAPTHFAQTPEAEAAGLEVEDFKRAIDRLLNAGIVENQPIEKGRGRHRLALKNG